MNLLDLERKMIAAAKADPPSDRVPHAFERRIMAHLAPCATPDPWTPWARVWWRATTPCLAITLLLGAWTFVAGLLTEHSASLATDLESTVYAAIDSAADSW
jgi:hypothetical protein